eukprot:TRINITY_DN10710_c0_g1_i1.p1 TRINITY_DN10710_c0_g1~~TRINITY_DN10710_c0_g1_i1.p1  ORF type:complete len:119 (+),score=4.53 TRINITY_DN10710_c0_g1_i1:271-627(+)
MVRVPIVFIHISLFAELRFCRRRRRDKVATKGRKVVLKYECSLPICSFGLPLILNFSQNFLFLFNLELSQPLLSIGKIASKNAYVQTDRNGQNDCQKSDLGSSGDVRNINDTHIQMGE